MTLSTPSKSKRRWRLRALLALLILCPVLYFAGNEWGKSRTFSQHFQRALSAAQLGHNAVAIQNLAVCREMRPEDPQVLLLASRLARRSGNWPEAEAFIAMYESRYGESEATVLERLLLRAARGEIESSAVSLRNRLGQSTETDAFIREALTVGLMYRFRWAEAEDLLTGWLEIAPNEVVALMLKGKLHQQREEDAKAVEVYRRIIDELDPEQDEARARLANLYCADFRGEEALRILEPVRQRLGANEQVDVLYGTALRLARTEAEARDWLERCRRDYPNNPVVLAELARFALASGQLEEAEQLYRESLRYDPGNVTNRYQYSQILQRAGKTAEASESMDTLKRVEADIKSIRELIQTKLPAAPRDAQLHYEIAAITLRTGRDRDALRWLEIALQLDPQHAPSHLLLASYYQTTGNPILASRHRALAGQAKR